MKYPTVEKVLAAEPPSDEQEEEIIERLAGEVESWFHSQIKPMVDKKALEICKKVGIDPEEFTRRSYDGVKQNKWLVELMLGDLLSEGKVKY